jgi:outer membrane protein TolC
MKWNSLVIAMLLLHSAAAQESYRMTHEKFKNRMAGNSYLLYAETALLQAALTYTQAKVDYRLAAVKLKRAVGAMQ